MSAVWGDGSMTPGPTTQASGVIRPEEICEMYAQLLLAGWARPDDYPVRMMNTYARRLGHYMVLARLEREQRERNVQHLRDQAAERNTSVHPLMRDMVNDIAIVYGLPRPWRPER